MLRRWLKKTDFCRRNSRRGFTLVEMAIVLTISGVLGFLFVPALMLDMRLAEVSELKSEFLDIDRAIEDFRKARGRYPCAAARNIPSTDPNFGLEVACNAAAAGTASVQGAALALSNIRIGAVPVKALNLGMQYAFDPWDRQYTYAVTESLATTGGYVSNGGNLRIIDSGNNPVVEPADTAHYIIVSHGEDEIGSFNKNGDTNAPGGCVGNTGDLENCNEDGVFRKTDYGDENAGPTHYDDYAYHRGHAQLQLPNSLPSGAIMATKQGACPLGWTTATPQGALAPAPPAPIPDLRGHVILGMGDVPGGGTVSYTYSNVIQPSRSWDYTKIPLVPGNPQYAFQERGGFGTYVMDMAELPSHQHLSQSPLPPPTRGGMFFQPIGIGLPAAQQMKVIYAFRKQDRNGDGDVTDPEDLAAVPPVYGDDNTTGDPEFALHENIGASCSPGNPAAVPPVPPDCTGQQDNRPPYIAMTFCVKQ